MIGSLTGKVFFSGRNPIIISVGGVGYSVHVPPRFVAKLKKDDTMTLFIHTHVREDALDLFGFPTQDEVDLFELCLTVSGIGPKTGLLVIDRGVSQVKQAITTSDVDFFTSIPRLGKKNAQKIIIELKSKIGSTKDLDLAGDASGETKELLDALLSMGFKRDEAFSAIKKLGPEDKTTEQKIRKALKLLRKP